MKPADDAAVPLGHNGGPPLDEPDPGAASWRLFCWKKAHRKAWRTPRDIVLRRLERAEAVGMTYREYSLEIMERGTHL